MRYLFAIGFIVIYTAIVGQQIDSSIQTYSNIGVQVNEPIKDVEYNGNESLNKFINKNIKSEIKKYIRNNCFTKTLYAQMKISKTGTVSEINIMNGEDNLINDEIIRILKMTSWNPASVKGKPVSRKILVPVSFIFL